MTATDIAQSRSGGAGRLHGWIHAARRGLFVPAYAISWTAWPPATVDPTTSRSSCRPSPVDWGQPLPHSSRCDLRTEPLT